MNKEKPLIQLRDLSVTFMTKSGGTDAIKNINLEIKEGEFISIVGPSGCGKSTLLSVIAGLILPTTGTFIKNFQTAGYMFQQDFLLPWRTIKANALLGLEVKNIKTKEKVELALELLEGLGLKDFLNYYPNQLSGGMRQRVALARTLVLEPDVLLLDEPFSALDYQTRLNTQQEISLTLRKRNKTVILVTHDISEAISMSDRVVILSKRPGTILKDIVLQLESDDKDPFSRRKAPSFGKYFNLIWEVLNHEITTN
ncbi:ABC transporter ATP-binding protein [Anaerobranca gottschalkii]|uniref:NitT/TauT family transport system ATP-binding protein n=1 Tax=Anaerobranca gottschalkii DSM 13577 TaxID=1120990 RepID=A0A1H9Y886_9FIRM|nr:ABC transporter ATP-binding protein [Anaerobranca gottschalkii]SES65031.1 NitT/TauT family transport system ATP-binding protein [Anaerobranca gottschalkii DSM 13577]